MDSKLVWCDIRECWLCKTEEELAKEVKHQDMVNSPSHYTSGDMETIDVIKHITRSYTGFQAALVSNVTKYIDRANFKGNKLQDLKKAKWYMDRLVKEVEDETEC